MHLRFMEPLQIRLSTFEVTAMLQILNEAKERCGSAPVKLKCKLHIDTIILSEFHTTWWKKTAALAVKPATKKDPMYRIPVSICRIVHYRLQHLPVTHANQCLLKRLDVVLVNADLRPPIVTPIF